MRQSNASILIIYCLQSIAIAGFSYLVIFDAFGTLNNFVSSVLHLNPAFSATNTKRPFG